MYLNLSLTNSVGDAVSFCCYGSYLCIKSIDALYEGIEIWSTTPYLKCLLYTGYFYGLGAKAVVWTIGWHFLLIT